jgi:protein CpxP
MMPPPTPRPFAGVEFNAQQREQIQQMMEQERKAHQQRVERMQTVQAQLQQLYLAEQWDATAIVALYEKLHAEQRNTIAAMAEARNRVYALMSKEQREQMRHQQQEQLKRLAAPPPSQQ